MKKQIFRHIIFLAFFCIAQGKIVESETLSAIKDYLSIPDTLIVLDIDNTLARSRHELGSDEWFCYLVNQKVALGYDQLSAINASLPLFYYAQFNIPLVPTEAGISTLLSNLTQRNIYSMGLTSRGLFLAERTHEQLINISINFHIPVTHQTEFMLPLPYPCLYKYGTIFTGNNDKGETLFTFLDIINYRPHCIIFVDDKMYHVESVERAAISKNIPYVGIRYSGCDIYINNFDPKKADAQLRELRKKNTTQSIWHYPITLFTTLISLF